MNDGLRNPHPTLEPIGEGADHALPNMGEIGERQRFRKGGVQISRKAFDSRHKTQKLVDPHLQIKRRLLRKKTDTGLANWLAASLVLLFGILGMSFGFVASGFSIGEAFGICAAMFFGLVILMTMINRLGRPDSEIGFWAGFLTAKHKVGEKEYVPRKARSAKKNNSAGPPLPPTAESVREIRSTSANAWIPARESNRRRKR